MMKVSDPIIFGHAVRAFFPTLFDEHGAALERRGRQRRTTGMAALLTAIEQLPDARARGDPRPRSTPRTTSGPALAMVDSERGITNLHVPSDVIIDASMPAAIRASGQMWNAAGEQQDTKFVIPDHSYAPLYAETVERLPRSTARSTRRRWARTPNVGLMAQQAEEYGSHDKTFEIAAPGTRARRRRRPATTLLEHEVEARATSGACARPRTRRSTTGCAWPSRAPRATGAPAVFWLDETRAARRASCCARCAPALDAARHRRAPDRDPRRRRGDALHARARPRAARTRSRSPATCCATT